ncbi:SCO1860 family LAETG-anchored protein [Streptomyces sp. NPDC049954]|uniref:SCO1860 family LAETG-anchored protein n=1 Tax=Streptomyces sp. NPDC049954 TaxID=3155779 RepID=UPI00343DB343
MNSNTFGLPARRLAAASTAVVLTAVPSVLATAASAHATDGHGGKASAVVLRAGLHVSLADDGVDVPLDVSLNEVRAPHSAEETALTARLDGVDHGKPFSMLSAEAATADATVDGRRAEGHTNLARARVHLPGLPLLSLVEVEKVTSRALCESGGQPVAESNVLGHVKVLGKTVRLSAGGTTRVDVPGVGEVALDLSKRSTTSRTAAASALELHVSVNPLKLNVAKVEGTVTLAGATCESPTESGTAGPAPQESATPTPAGEQPAPGTEDEGGKPATEPKAQGAAGAKATGSGDNLAETGGSSATPYVAGGAAALLIAGAGAVVLARSRTRGRRG